MEGKIVEYLKEKYKPVAMLLHGSRAIGKERLHSDWDIFMLFEDSVPKKSNREEVDGEDVEWKAFSLPVINEQIVDKFDANLQFAKVLWEKGGDGTDLLNRAKVEYAKGPNLSDEDLRRIGQFLAHKLNGMEDYLGDQFMFARHLSVFFSRAAVLWFEILHNEFSKPYYLAMPIIKEKDPEYFKQLEILTAINVSNEDKIKVGRQIYQKLFS